MTSTELDSAVDALMHIVQSRPDTPPAEDQKPIQAYAKLQGEDFVYFIRTLSVLLGRKTSPYDEVQVDLGNSKVISRVHARIEYNFVSRSFEIACLGKNGIFVEGKFLSKDASPIPLDTKTLIQIGEKWFYFLLPVTTVQPKPADEYQVGKRPSFSRSHTRDGSPQGTGPVSPSSSYGGEGDGEIPDFKLYGDVKPPYSYASLIAQAVYSTPDKRLSLSSIYQFITDNYPYYRTAQNGWQNSIRHNLSLNKAFIKIARSENEPGKGAFWAIDPQFNHHFSEGNFIFGPTKRKPSQPTLKHERDESEEPERERKRGRSSIDGAGNDSLVPESATIAEAPSLDNLPPPQDNPEGQADHHEANPQDPEQS